ncbi:MAG: hypothetical protein WC663_06015 [Patescibacteria group bacterium]|jgi:hypothetical protein
MKLDKDLWIEGGYYIDFDELGQFRIIGPNNHLYLGLIDIPRHKIKINKVESTNGKVKIDGTFLSERVNLYYPAMDDIRTMRSLITKEYAAKPFVSFLEIRQNFFDKLVPQVVKHRKVGFSDLLVYKRFYGEKYWYQTLFEFTSNDVVIESIDSPYKGHQISDMTKKGEINFRIISSTNDINRSKIKSFFEPIEFNFDTFGKYKKTVEYFWKMTEVEVRHLITWGKTSGDYYGTIFPRDWMETSDLGVHDLLPKVRDYMYEVSLKNIDKDGEGWHEDVVGEYKYEHQLAGKDIFNRRMIDIEPHYIFGLKMLSNDFLINKENKEKIKLTANYILKQARENNLILFKKLPKELQTKDKKYYEMGDWRDSEWSYKKISPKIAPFDVNVVFYPEALRVLKDYQEKLGMTIPDIDDLIKKWNKVKGYYKFKNEDGLLAYALALYDVEGEKKGKKIKYKQYKVNHIDESYLYTYCDGSKNEIESFCKRLLDKKYFYTDAGPVLVGQSDKAGFTTMDYHGLVIWTKQTAYIVLGLSKHLKKSIVEEWDKDLQKLIKKTLLVTCENMIKAFDKLKMIPELHYCDDQGKARFWTEQSNVGGRMSKVQLWSAVGARRIIRKYYELMSDIRYKI